MEQLLLAALNKLKIVLDKYLEKHPPPLPPVTPLAQNTPILPTPTQEGIEHDEAWCGGSLSDRTAMYMLAKSVCQQEAMTPEMTRDLLATIYGESGFNQWAKNDKNKNGTCDWGLCQYNDGKIREIPLWIGPGAAFASKEEVLNNPEKCVRVMCRMFKAGHARWWDAYPTRSKYFGKTPA